MSDLTNPILFYDGDCKLCNKAINFVLDHEKGSVLHFASLDSKTSKEVFSLQPIPEDVDSLVLFVDDEILIESKAALRIASYLKFPYSLGKYLGILPASILNLGYRWVAKNRMKWFGINEVCALHDEQTMKRFLN